MSTLSARDAPPQGATTVRAAASLCSAPSPGATTTSTLAIRCTGPNAASVCRTIGAPATGWYCLGCAVPAREPVPAQGSSAKQRASPCAAAAAVLVVGAGSTLNEYSQKHSYQRWWRLLWRLKILQKKRNADDPARLRRAASNLGQHGAGWRSQRVPSPSGRRRPDDDTPRLFRRHPGCPNYIGAGRADRAAPCGASSFDRLARIHRENTLQRRYSGRHQLSI